MIHDNDTMISIYATPNCNLKSWSSPSTLADCIIFSYHHEKIALLIANYLYFNSCDVRSVSRNQLILQGCYNSEYVRFLIICMYKWFIENEHNDMCFNHLYNYFTSARNDDEKIQRIEDFIKGIFMSTFLDASQMDNPDANSRCGIFLMAFSKFIVECVFLFFEVSLFCLVNNIFLRILNITMIIFFKQLFYNLLTFRRSKGTLPHAWWH